jgi:predicted nuclease of predicted toxin-antitoxin system
MAEIRYLLDEHVAHAVAAGLRRRGIEAATATDASLLGADDSEYIAYANATSRVIVTHDSDFLQHHQRGVQHAGIVYCEQSARSIGQIIGGLVLIHEALDAEDMAARVEFL